MPPALTPTLLLELVGIGLGAGLIGGLLGIGGGAVMIPAMVFVLGAERFGVESFHLYKLAAITTTIVLSGPAVARHVRARAVVPRIVRSTAGFAIVGVFVGAAAAALFDDQQTVTLRRIFGGFLLFAVFVSLAQTAWLRQGGSLASSAPVPWRWAPFGLLAGLPAGVIAGLLGVGGGVWSTPMQRLVLGVRLRNAIANSATTILPIAIVTSIVLGMWVHRATELSMWSGYLIAACLAPGAIVGAWFGAGFTHRVPVRTLRLCFDALLAVAGARLLFA